MKRQLLALYLSKVCKLKNRDDYFPTFLWKINWNESADKINGRINGLYPNPGAWFKYKNERYKVWKAKIGNENGSAGKILDKNFTVACKERSIKILEIQKEGKSRQAIDQFLLGNKIKEGENMF